MKTIIKVNISEQNEGLDKEYANVLKRSIEEVGNADQLVTFTLGDFMDYSPSAK